jgi:hypothetical protein
MVVVTTTDVLVGRSIPLLDREPVMKALRQVATTRTFSIKNHDDDAFYSPFSLPFTTSPSFQSLINFDTTNDAIHAAAMSFSCRGSAADFGAAVIQHMPRILVILDAGSM